MSFSDLEPLIDDARLERLEAKLRRAFVLPESTLFVTFVQPRGIVRLEDGQETTGPLGVFAVMSPNPRAKKGERVMTRGDIPLATWDREEKMRGHFAGVRDLADEVYRPIVRRHLETMKNLAEMI